MFQKLIDRGAVTNRLPFNLVPRQREVTQALQSTALSESEEANSRASSTSHAKLVEAIQRINEVLHPYDVKFEISESSRVITRVVDKISGEVLRQYPSEETLHIAERLDELKGLLVKHDV